MCHALIGQGVDTLIATTDADGSGRLDVEIGRAVSYKNVPTIFFPRQWSEAFKYSRPLARWLHQSVEGFDVVHIHAVFSHACLAAATACREKGVPYIVRPLGSLDPWSLKQKRLKKILFWHLGVKRMLDGAAAIHYTTDAEREAAERSVSAGRGVVVPLGIEEQFMNEVAEGSENKSRDPSAKSPYVLVLSRLHQKKGLELLLPAFLSVVKQAEFAGWKLVLVGEGESKYVESLKRLVHSCGGNGNVVFAGWLDGAQRSDALREASLLALTSYQENFGLCAVEAMACGVPVMLSPHVNLSDDVRKAGAGWVSELNTAALQRTLAESLRDQKELTRRGALGKELVRQRFTWDAVAKTLTDLYVSIAANGKKQSEYRSA
jgi:glycosyltransferase involved in cell wall biosynthesis